MDCPLRSGQDLAEAYVAGTLPESEQTAFEQHFFTCQACLSHVALLQDVRDRLASVPSRPKAHDPRWKAAPWLGLALAAGLLAAFGWWWRDGDETPAPQQAAVTAPASAPVETPTSAPAPTTAPTPVAPPATPAPGRRELLGQLALVVPPRYVPLAVRGASAPAGTFDAAMEHYVAGRYAEAATALKTLSASHADDPGVQFFLGVSALATGRTAIGRQALERVVTLDVQPYADEAHFYLGKAAIASGDLAAATRELTLAEGKAAGPEGEATRILAAIARLPAESGAR
jgi:TolA-binding protein